MLRPIVPEDTESLIDLTARTGFFKPIEIEALREVLDDYHSANRDLGHRSYAWEESGAIAGYAYYAPAAMTDRTWYVYWLAVSKDVQGRGLGRQILEFVEKDIREQNGRLLLIETSSTPHYDPTRRFYLKNGYVLTANIPDFYSDDDGMIVFSKRLIPAVG